MKVKEKVQSFLGLRGNLLSVTILELISNNGWNMFEVIWQPYVLGLGASISILGRLAGLHTALHPLLQLIMGRISDCIGRKRPLIASYILTILGIFLAIIAKSWYLLIPTIILWSLSQALWEPIFPTMISESVERDVRGTAFSLISLTWFIPGFYAPLLAGFIAERYGFQPVIGILLLTEFTALVIFVVYIRETLKSRKTFDLDTFFGSLKSVLKPGFGLTTFYAAVIIDRFAWAIIGGIFFGMLLETYDFTLIQLGILANTLSISVAFSQILVGKLVDRYGSRRFLAVSGGISILVFMGYLISRTFYSFIICQVFRGLAISTWDPSVNTYFSSTVPENERGRFFGDLNCLKGLISFPAPIVGAFLYEAYGFQAPILASIIFSIMVIPLFLSVRER